MTRSTELNALADQEIWACCVSYFHNGANILLLNGGQTEEAAIGNTMKNVPDGAIVAGKLTLLIAALASQKEAEG